ncbi:MAG: hypothetical protein A3G18_09165 [Rhodospirillales bacterium RIFCSPLOWO2_12_FULL_58_28]|nr:MAG: hypothetical protein A3H92_13410 [Rhodospirillales bacterium RIFCSPLOWO2_02_FULL_58_16]OHC76670.1 MAG: hypothetical protein A3G18_09165 [Rhodospirillales bacterium RIFCSPLOWO2_12_FULL_58_28]
MRRIIFLFIGLFCVCAAAAQASDVCVPTGRWLEPASGKTVAHAEMIARMAKRPVVLLGETHDNKEHHSWQLHVIAAMHAQNPNMVLAFESFPRRFQPVLDKWTRGDLTEEAFLKEVEWNDIWRFDAGLYMGLFDFARIHRVPMVAMNIDRKLIARIAGEGWKAIAEGEREGLSDPAPADESYLDFLSTVFGMHDKGKPESATASEHDKADKIKALPVPEMRNNPMFLRFVESQVLWDRAMAQKIAEVRFRGGAPLVVGIVGQGHIQYGFGIPHQLADLGLPGAAVLLPWDDGQECSDLKPIKNHQVADAVFGLAAPDKTRKPDRPKLGVYIEDAAGGVLINKMVDKSIAETSGLMKDDLIMTAAGEPVAKVGQLVEIVSRQAPGTWLPLTVKRGDETIEIIARFPPRQ